MSPYEKGEMFSMLRSVASLAPTLSLVLIRLTSLWGEKCSLLTKSHTCIHFDTCVSLNTSETSFHLKTQGKGKLTKISMVPLEILVVIPRAWKKEVFSGPRPVFWAGTVTLQGAMAPARAAAGTCGYRECINLAKYFT